LALVPQGFRNADLRQHVASLLGLSVKSVLGAAGPYLGDMVWWTLADANTDRTTLVSTWTGEGLVATLLLEPPTAEKALKTAIRFCQVGLTEHLIRGRARPAPRPAGHHEECPWSARSHRRSVAGTSSGS
jgi:hypothetical protein